MKQCEKFEKDLSNKETICVDGKEKVSVEEVNTGCPDMVSKDKINQKIELFRSTPDASFYSFLQKLHSIFAVILGVGILLIFFALLPGDAIEELFGVSYYDSGAIRFGIGFVGFLFGIPAILLSIKLLKKIGKTRENCVTVVQKNHIIVYEGLIEGCTCDLQLNGTPKFEMLSIAFGDIVRIQVERERCDFKFDNPMVDVLCIYTDSKKYKIWAIADVQTFANNINTLLKK